MPGENISIAVGQCGNQLSWDFYNALVTEHGILKRPTGPGIGQWFRRYLDSDRKVHHRARCVMIDTEEGVLNTLARTHRIAGLFDGNMMHSAPSGTGNNWARGYYEFGDMMDTAIETSLRHAAEACDSPHTITLFHSMSGGSGSGLGSRVLETVHDMFPAQGRITLTIAPSVTDDVVTAPYNALLTAAALIEHSDLTLTADNASLAAQDAGVRGSTLSSFSSINRAAVDPLLALTAPSRLGGPVTAPLLGMIADTAGPHMPFVTFATRPDLKTLFRPDCWSLSAYLTGPLPTLTSGVIIGRGQGLVNAAQVRSALDKATRCRVGSRLARAGPARYETSSSGGGVSMVGATSLVGDMLEDGILSKFDRLFRAKAHMHTYEAAGADRDSFVTAREIVATCAETYKIGP